MLQFLRSSSSISRLKTTMYSPSIAVGVSTLNRGAVQSGGKEIDAVSEYWRQHARRTFQVVTVCKCAGCKSENDSCNLHVCIRWEIATECIALISQSDARRSYHTPYKVTQQWKRSHGCHFAHAQIWERVTEHVSFVSSTPIHNASL
jgi:hypothetical protein